MVAEFPQVAKLANVQCEPPWPGCGARGCSGDPSGSALVSTRDLRAVPAEDPYHVFPQQWEVSAHADKNAQAFWYPIGENRLACVGCHSGAAISTR